MSATTCRAAEHSGCGPRVPKSLTSGLPEASREGMGGKRRGSDAAGRSSRAAKQNSKSDARRHIPVGDWPEGRGIPLSAAVAESEFQRSHRDLRSPLLKVGFVNCPLETSMGVLGKKWTLLLIRDIGAYGVDRFSGLRKSLPAIPSKVLATRLKQLEREGFLRRTVEKGTPPKVIRWSLTEKGIDAIRVGMMMSAFGSRWCPDSVFEDKRPRTLRELYTPEALDLFLQCV